MLIMLLERPLPSVKLSDVTDSNHGIILQTFFFSCILQIIANNPTVFFMFGVIFVPCSSETTKLNVYETSDI